MTAADDAYQRAQEIIAEAKVSGTVEVSFDEAVCRALTTIPPDIAALNAVSIVSLDNTQVTDLAPLSSMTRMQTLMLNNTQVADLAPLSSMTGMQTLMLKDTRVTDLTPLSSMTRMQTLMLNNTQVSDLAPLSSMTGMQSLMLDNTQVTDLTPLSGMTGMQTLWLDDTQVTDLRPLSSMTEMQKLWLRNTQVTDLSPLSGMTKMQMLMLRSTQVADLTPLSGMTGMKTLWVNDSQVTDLTPLSGMTAMQTLSLNNTQVADLTPLSGMTGMQTLWLDNTQVTDLTPLSGMTAMQMLYFHNTEVADLTPLSGMTAMQTLYFHNTQVADLTPLSGMTKLIEGEKSGVFFFNTPAASKKELRDISLINDSAACAMALLAYLNEPAPPPKDKSDVPAMNVGDDGVVRSQDFAPDITEDPDQEDMRQEVLRKVRNLIDAVGTSNEWAGLARTAEHYQKQVDRPLNEFKLGMLYSAFNTLRLSMEAEESAQAQGWVNDYLPPKIGVALTDLVQTHGLFFMGFPTGAEIHAQAMSGLTTAPVNLLPEVSDIVASLAGKDTVLDAEDQAAMQDDLAAANGNGRSAQIGANRLRARIWNMMGAIGRASWKGGQWGTLALAAHDLPAWVIGNQTVIAKFLIWAQGPGAIWFHQMIQSFKIMP